MARTSAERPQCRVHPAESLSQVATGWYCDACGSRVVGFEDWPGPQEPIGARCVLSDVPSFLAIKIAEVDRESHPVVRLWGICEAVEILLRMVTTVAVADVRRASGGVPDEFVRTLAERIRRPSLGVWREVGTYFVTMSPPDALVPEFAADMDGSIRVLLEKVNPLRNNLAHGGGIPSLFAAYRVGPLASELAHVLGALVWLTELRFEASTRTGAVLLRGVGPIDASDLELSEPLSVTVRRPGHAQTLELFPLLAALRVEGSPLLQPSIYVRSDAKHLEHLALGDAGSFQRLRGQAVRRFRDWFRLDDQTSLLGTLDDFDEDCWHEAARVRGREDEARTIVDTVTATPPPPISWVHGVPGAGKSAVISKVVQQLRSSGLFVVFWRFRAGDPRCNRGAFLRHVLSRLEKELRVPPTPFGGQLDVLERAVADYVERLERPVLLAVDGLDEIARIDPGFVDLPLRMASESCRWLLTGRPEPVLTSAFDKRRCAWAFDDGNGLPPLGAEGIAEWLKHEMPSGQVARYLRHEEEWLGEVVRASGGIAQYVKLLLDELGQGLVAVGASLPEGLDAYWRRLLTRAGADDSLGLVPIVVAIVCLAEEAPTEAFIAETLRVARPAAATKLDDALVRRAIDHARPLFRFGLNASGAETVGVYHESLREHVRDGADYSASVEEAGQTLGAMCQHPERCTNPAVINTLFRTGIRQLLRLGRSPAAAALLAEPGYLIARLGFGPPAFNRDDEAAKDNDRKLAEIFIDALLVQAEGAETKEVKLLIQWLQRYRLEIVLGGGRMLFQQLTADRVWRHKTTLRAKEAETLGCWLEGRESTTPRVAWHDQMPAEVMRLALSRDGRYLCAVFLETPPEVIDTHLGTRIHGEFAGAREFASFDRQGQLHLAQGKTVEHWKLSPLGRLELAGCTTLEASVENIFASSSGPVAITNGEGIAQLIALADGRVLAETRNVRINLSTYRSEYRLDALPLPGGRCLLAGDYHIFSIVLDSAGEPTPCNVSEFYSLAVPTPDLQGVLCPDAWGQLRVISAADLKVEQTVKMRRARRTGPAVYPPLELTADERGELVVVVASDCSIIYVLPEQKAYVMRHGTGGADRCAVSGDGSTIAFACGAQVEIHATREVVKFGLDIDEGPQSHVVLLRLRERGDVIVAFADGSVWLWDQATGKKSRRVIEPTRNHPNDPPVLFTVTADSSLLAYTRGSWIHEVDLETEEESPMCLYDADGEPHDYEDPLFLFEKLVRSEADDCWFAEANDGSVLRSDIANYQLVEASETPARLEDRSSTYRTGPDCPPATGEIVEGYPHFVELVDPSRGGVAWWYHGRQITAHDVLVDPSGDRAPVVVFGDEFGNVVFLDLRKGQMLGPRFVVE